MGEEAESGAVNRHRLTIAALVVLGVAFAGLVVALMFNVAGAP